MKKITKQQHGPGSFYKTHENGENLGNSYDVTDAHIISPPGFITGEKVGQLAIVSRLNVTVFNEAVKKCCYSDEDCKIAFVGVSNAGIINNTAMVSS